MLVHWIATLKDSVIFPAQCHQWNFGNSGITGKSKSIQLKPTRRPPMGSLRKIYRQYLKNNQLSTHFLECFLGGGFNPLWKISVKMGILPNFWGEHKHMWNYHPNFDGFALVQVSIASLWRSSNGPPLHWQRDDVPGRRQRCHVLLTWICLLVWWLEPPKKHIFPRNGGEFSRWFILNGTIR